MKPVDFKQANKVFKKPESMTDEQCAPLPTFTGKDGGGHPIIISCWQLTEEEVVQLVKDGKVYLTIIGTGMPPVSLAIENPFING